MYSNLRHILFVLLGFGASVCIPNFVSASVSYTVTPLVIDAKVQERDIKNYTITLSNTGDSPATIYPTVNNISLDSGGSIQEFLSPVESDQTKSLASWIEISRAGIDLFPGTTKTISLVLRINPNAEPGDYHAFVGFPYGGNRDEAEKMVARGDAPGVVVSASFIDTKTSLLKVSHFLVDRFITTPDNQAVSYTLRNPGEEPLTPTGEIIFYNSRGEEVAAVAVNETGTVLLPNTEETFTGNVPAENMFGRYKAFLNVEYGKNNLASIQDTTFFYALPLRALLITLCLLLVTVIVLSLYVHRRYFDEVYEDGSELLPVSVRETQSKSLHHDIDLRKP